MIRKVLIANRGEIAVRIIRTCRELGIQTVAIYSEADQQALHVKLADEAYCIGASPISESYLKQDAILQVAIARQVDAIHPGYGFLSENDQFAQQCETLGIQFIGPSATAIQSMGLKDRARQTMQAANVPVVPGSDGLVDSFEEAHQIAEEIGYPVIIKATAGGGGKGIRIVTSPEELQAQWQEAQHEAESVFSNGGLYLEKFIESFRHIELQIIADRLGHTVHLGERDCTTQRRMQKLIEEAPSPALTPEVREQMGQAAVRAAKAVQYEGVGTVEFIYDTKTNHFYFMEMNTRIQVEHTITEMITGLDLIALQLSLANGEPLPFKQEEVTLNGWAIECRINAEDPLQQFMPVTGIVEDYHFPAGLGVRIDSAIQANAMITPYYDSMIAKVIVHAPTREAAIKKMQRALLECTIQGVPTTTSFLAASLTDSDFLAGDFEHNLFDQMYASFSKG